MSNTVKYETKVCPLCHQTGEVEVPTDGLLAWQHGQLIQKAMPDVPADTREQMITGTHPKCWIELFGDPSEMQEDFI